MREAFIKEIGESWELWARLDQWAPPDGLLSPGPHHRPEGYSGAWRTWLIMSGRGAGKTRTGSEWVNDMAHTFPGCRIALVGQTAADTRDVMIHGDSGIIACAKSDRRPRYNPSTRSLKWPNGSSALTFSGDVPDQLRGPQQHFAWIDELAKFRYAKLTWDNLQMGLRLGRFPRALVTTTPRPLELLKKIRSARSTVTTVVSTFHNRANLPESFFESLKEQYEGTRIAAQELYGEIIDEVPGALWSFETIARNRVTRTPDELDILAIGVDPSGSKEGDEVGIVMAGAVGREAFVVGDWSMNATTSQWAHQVVRLYNAHLVDVIVVEKNYGGEMCAQALRSAAFELKTKGEIESADLVIREITGTGSKAARAMPVSLAYEQGRVHHVGEFPKLEAEMRAFTVEWRRDKDKSPNRVDALVYAVKHVLDMPSPTRPVIFGSLSISAR